LCLLVAPAAFAGNPSLELSPTTSTDGVAQLTWESPGDAEVTLQSSMNRDFARPKILYVGRDGATTLTGLSDGDYFYRVGIDSGKADGTQWSDVVHLEVRHHPMSRAWLFFSVGVLVFAGVLIMVVAGARHHGKHAP
jgi:hypothetical protein